MVVCVVCRGGRGSGTRLDGEDINMGGGGGGGAKHYTLAMSNIKV